MESLYVNARYSLGKRLACTAKKFNPYPAEYGTLGSAGWLDQITCGHNPSLKPGPPTKMDRA